MLPCPPRYPQRQVVRRLSPHNPEWSPAQAHSSGPARPHPFGPAPPLTGLGVHGEVVLSIQHAVHQPSTAAIRWVIRIRGHHLHHRRAWAGGPSDTGVTWGRGTHPPHLFLPRRKLGEEPRLGNTEAGPCPLTESQPASRSRASLVTDASRKLESDLYSSLPPLAPSGETLAMEGSPSGFISSSAKWENSSPWFMRECVLNSQCRAAQSSLSGGGHGHCHQGRSWQSSQSLDWRPGT